MTILRTALGLVCLIAALLCTAGIAHDWIKHRRLVGEFGPISAEGTAVVFGITALCWVLACWLLGSRP